MRIDQPHAIGQPHHLFLQRRRRHRFQCQPDARGVLAGQAVAGEQQPLRPLRSAVIQPHRAGRRPQVAHRRKPDPRIIGHHHDIAEPREFGADADARAMHLRDHRLVHIEQRDAHALALLQPPDVIVDFLPPAILRPAAAGILRQIGAGTEMRTGAAQHHAMHRVMLVRLQQRRVQLAQQPAAQRVALLRPVERDDRSGALHRIGDVLEVHGARLSRVAAARDQRRTVGAMQPPEGKTPP